MNRLWSILRLLHTTQTVLLINMGFDSLKKINMIIHDLIKMNNCLLVKKALLRLHEGPDSFHSRVKLVVLLLSNFKRLVEVDCVSLLLN